MNLEIQELNKQKWSLHEFTKWNNSVDVKGSILNLPDEELDENKIKLLNLGPKFVPTENRKRPYMDIIQTTEICALDLEREG